MDLIGRRIIHRVTIFCERCLLLLRVMVGIKEAGNRNSLL